MYAGVVCVCVFVLLFVSLRAVCMQWVFVFICVCVCVLCSPVCVSEGSVYAGGALERTPWPPSREQNSFTAT